LGLRSESTNEWVVVDFETASSRGTPCQVAAVKYRVGMEVDAYTSLIFQPADKFDAFNICLHGITPEMVVNAPRWPAALEELLEFAGGSELVAHYAPFDMGVLRDACDSCALSWPSVRYTCTVSIARMVWPGLPSYSLLLLCSYLRISLEGGQHHQALYDSRLAGLVLQRAISSSDVTGLDALLDRISIRLGEISPDSWFGSHLRPLSAKQIPKPNPTGNPDSPFFGKVVVFTGELAIYRREAWRLVAEVGGRPEPEVTKRTDVLVCGYQDLYRLAQGETKSNRLRHAERLHELGQPIDVLSERDFFRLLRDGESHALISSSR
jgi:DNA polymerase III epsilon subunit-like protein